MAENANFSSEENDEGLENYYVIFGKNGLLEISDNLDNDEISLFFGENQNVHKANVTKTDLNIRLRGSVKEQGALEISLLFFSTGSLLGDRDHRSNISVSLMIRNPAIIPSLK